MTTPNSQCALNALAIDNPIEYARLALTGEMQDWVNAEDNLEAVSYTHLRSPRDRSLSRMPSSA